MIYNLNVLYINVKDMLKDIVSHANNNYSYILPLNSFSEPLVGFKCKSTKKEWTIRAESWIGTMAEEERMIFKNSKTRNYFCRAASCRMYDSFHKEISAYISSRKWHQNLSIDEGKYVKLINRYHYLVRKFN